MTPRSAPLQSQRFVPGLALCAVALLAVCAVHFAQVFWLKIPAGLALLMLLPGLSFSLWLLPKGSVDLVSRGFIGVALSLGGNAFALMLLYFLAGRFSIASVSCLMAGLTALGAVCAWFFPQDPGPAPAAAPPSRLTLAIPLLILGFSAALRLYGLGYSEFQGDEADNVMKTAFSLVRGESGALVANRRPPAQVLTAAATTLLCGRSDEGLVRFPFAIAGTGCVWMMWLVVSGMAGSTAGSAAALFAAVCGFLVAFSRMVQYQSLVTLHLLVAIFFIQRFLAARTSSAGGTPVALLTAAVAFGFAALSHYESFLALPALLYLAGMSRGEGPYPWRTALSALLVSAGMILAFYLPFRLSPSYASTYQFYSESRFNFEERTGWFSLESFFIYGPFYNTQRYLLIIGLLGVVAFIPRRPLPGRGMLLMWFLTAFLCYTVVVQPANTHIYTYFVPLIMLAGIGFSQALGWARALEERYRIARILPTGAMSLLLLMAGLGTGIDIYKRFVRQSPEYLWAHKPTVKKGLFGFAYRRGWKTIGGLYRTGSLNAPYISNEKSDVTKYYLGKSQSALGDAQIILNVEGAQTFRNKIPIPDGFVQFLTVRVHGKPAIQAYAKTAPWPGIKVLDAETSDPAFHQIDLAAAP